MSDTALIAMLRSRELEIRDWRTKGDPLPHGLAGALLDTEARLSQAADALTGANAREAAAWDEGWDSGNFYAIDDFNRGHKTTNPHRTVAATQ